MERHTSNCMVCGKPLQYFDRSHNMQCIVCGGEFLSQASCEDGHFVCDGCHAKKGIASIAAFAHKTKSDDPIKIAAAMMRDEHVNMHGPEHHFLIVAALLAAYKNAGGEIDLQTALIKARERAEQVPGGICGFWGCCGAAVGSGIFVSIITAATPLSGSEWSLSNLMTSKSLAAIAENGGPRCCKRDVYLAIGQAVHYTKEQFGISMGGSEPVRCPFFKRNNECREIGCCFYPQKR